MTPRPQATVADVIGASLAARGVEDVFGVLGSGNLVVTNALCAGGARFHHARHESGAITMADGYARRTGRTGVCSVHQGPGLTNTITGLTEAVKSRTPLLVLAGDTPTASLTGNFKIDQDDLVASVGAIPERLHSAATAARDAGRALHRAELERRPVVLMMPIDVQAEPWASEHEPPAEARHHPRLAPPDPDPAAIDAVADAIARAQRPAIIAGRGAALADAADDLEALGELTGALLATSAAAHGLFHGLPFSLGIAGGFSSPYAAELLAQADLILAFGASLNPWTTRHGELLHPAATVVHIDADPMAIGRHRCAQLAVVADAGKAARALTSALERRSHRATGLRTHEIAAEVHRRQWPREPYVDAGTDEYIDPRTFTLALDGKLPAQRTIAVDSGHFIGYPAMYLTVPDPTSWLFVNAFQAVGLGLATAIGAAVADPDRSTMAAVGDGGAFMSLPEIETAVRLKLGNLLVVVYDDNAYGAEVHHFAALGHDVSRARFPDADLAALAAAAGARAATIRAPSDLGIIEDWLEARSGHPLVLVAKVNPSVRAEWLQETFRTA